MTVSPVGEPVVGAEPAWPGGGPPAGLVEASPLPRGTLDGEPPVDAGEEEEPCDSEGGVGQPWGRGSPAPASSPEPVDGAPPAGADDPGGWLDEGWPEGCPDGPGDCVPGWSGDCVCGPAPPSLLEGVPDDGDDGWDGEDGVEDGMPPDDVGGMGLGIDVVLLVVAQPATNHTDNASPVSP